MRVKEYQAGELKRLPDWVKCVKCRKPPTETDWLLEVIPHSSCLIHQSCAAGEGKIAGLNIGISDGT